MRNSFTRTVKIHWALLIISVILSFIIALLSLIPIPHTINEQFDGNSVLFSVSDRILFQPGECLELEWEVNGPPSIEVDGRGRSGSKIEERCIDGFYTPRLKLNLADGSEVFYSIDMIYVIYQPLFWVSIFVITVCGYGGLYLLFRNWAIDETLAQGHLVYRLFTGVISFAVIVFVSLLSIEFGLKYYVERFGTQTMQEQFIMSNEALLDKAEVRLVLRPVPFITYLPEFHLLNNLGYRGEDTIIPKPQNTYRIVTLGGSTTYGTGIEDPALAYPAQLERILKEDYGYSNVDVVNAGVPTWNTWNSLANLAFRVLETDPDMILIFHGINDTYPRTVDPECFNQESPYLGLPPNWGHVERNAYDYGDSTLWRFLGINLGWMPNPIGQASGIEVQLTRDICPERAEDPLAAIQENSADYFERNMRSMIGIAQIHDIEVMLSTWTYFELRDFEVQAVQEHNEMTTRLAEQYDLLFYDLHANFPVDPAYWPGDLLHMNAAGTLKQAELYAEYLANSGILPSP